MTQRTTVSSIFAFSTGGNINPPIASRRVFLDVICCHYGREIVDLGSTHLGTSIVKSMMSQGFAELSGPMNGHGVWINSDSLGDGGAGLGAKPQR